MRTPELTQPFATTGLPSLLGRDFQTSLAIQIMSAELHCDAAALWINDVPGGAISQLGFIRTSLSHHVPDFDKNKTLLVCGCVLAVSSGES